MRAQDNPWAAALEQYSKIRAATFTRPLPLPPALAPAAHGNEDHFELAIRRGHAQPLDGAATEILGYGGRWPGAMIVATKGRLARVRVKNEIDENASLHNHGHNSAASSDGHPIDYIRPGATKEYVYPNNQTGGTYWFHDHAFGLTGQHVYYGMAGFYLIHDPAEDALALPSGAYDVPIAIQDRMFDDKNALSYPVNAGTLFNGFLGNALCANGVVGPRLEVAARKYRFRLLNGCNSRNLKLALADGGPLIQIAADGSLLEAPVVQRAVAIAPSERADVVIDFSRYTVGSSVVLKNVDKTWPELPDVLRFDIKRKESDDSKLPDKLAEVPRLDARKAIVTRHIKLQLADGQWTINGQKYDPARVEFRPRLGTVEIWDIKNTEQTQMHPFHQHLVQFQVLDIDGQAPPPELRGWKDTVAVGPSARVRIIMHFRGEPGVYVFHCHKLEHEDHAMMAQQEVVA